MQQTISADLPRRTGVVLEGGGFEASTPPACLMWRMDIECYCRWNGGSLGRCCLWIQFQVRQVGRVLRYNTAYAADPRYASLRNWLRTGDQPQP